MRDRSCLPLLQGKTNHRNTLHRVKTLESIPEHTEDSHNILWPHALVSVDAVKSPGINLPKLVNKSQLHRPGTPSKLDYRATRSPKTSGFLNIENMRLSRREKATERMKRTSDTQGANFLIYKPSFETGHVTPEVDLSRYAFRAALDRIPETDGERLLSENGKIKSDSADKKKRNLGTTEKSSEGEKTLAKINQPSTVTGSVVCLRNLDLFAQQEHYFARHGPPTRVAFSYKMIQGDLQSFMEQRNQELYKLPAKLPQLNAEEVVFPKIVLYQWEVHERPKAIKTFRPRKAHKKKVHRIPTGNVPQEYHPGDGEVDERDCIAIRPDSSIFKLPKAPPSTPKCESRKELELQKSGTPEHY